MGYKRFGVMLDCTSRRMKVETIKKFADVIAKMGYNCIQLYMEDSYELEGYPWFGYLRGRYTKAELKDLDAYMQSKGIELMPCMQTLGHLACVNKNYAMKHLFDTNSELLVGDEAVYEFIDKCFETLSECFTSRYINIGMDESYGLGRGKYLKKHGYREQFDIFTEHLEKVAALAKKHGLIPITWSDMFFRINYDGEYSLKGAHIPEEVRKKIPENVELVYWEYVEDNKDVYVDMIKAHKETNREVWFAGGLETHHGWPGSSLHRQMTYRMNRAMEAVREEKIDNVIITVWGGINSFFSYLPAYYALRQMADGVTDMEKIKAGFKELIGYEYDDFMLLSQPGSLINEKYQFWGEGNAVGTMFYADPFMGYMDADYEEKLKGRVILKEPMEKIAEAKKRMGEYAYFFDEVEKRCRFMEIKMELGLRTRAAYRANDKERMRTILGEYDEAVKRLVDYYEARRYSDAQNNLGFGFEITDMTFGGLERRLKSCKAKLLSWVNGEISRIEELEEDIMVVNRDAVTDVYSNMISRYGMPR